jgi:hypothetical protein
MEKCSFCGHSAEWKCKKKEVYVYMCKEHFLVYSVNYENYEAIKNG